MTVLETSPTQPGDFASRLRALREAAGLTQEELAEKAGLTAYAVSALERGRRQRPYPHTVRSLADALGTTDADRALLLSSVPRRTAAAPAVPTQPAPVPALAPVRTSEAGSAGLPVATTRLLGRDAELAALQEMLVQRG